MDKSRIISAYLFLLIVILILTSRYAYLQLFNHNFLLEKSINNYTAVVVTQSVRGGIIDTNNTVLANNKVAYAVAILPKNSKDIQNIFIKLPKFINLTELDKKKYYKQLNNSKNYDWVIIKDNLSNTEISNLTSHAYLFPELNIYAHTKRVYPFADVYSHSLGYVGRISSVDKERIDKAGHGSNYLTSDYIGKSGLEQYYESFLRGTIGKKVIQTDAYGNEVGLLKSQPAIDGNTLKLTINNDLQQKAWQLLGNQTGAIVAINPQNGGVLAFVSKPSYDANLFLDGISPEDWDDLSNDPKKPLLNRALQGTYPPGSTFKPFLGLAALYLGIRTPNWTMNDPGYFMLPGSTHKFRDDVPYGFGVVNMSTAISKSSDVYFYKLALDMGIDRIDKTMRFFGFGKKTGIDINGENKGLLPSREWKAKVFAKNIHQKNWLAADSVTLGIGQGFNHYTPLQMAFATTIIANDGKIAAPHFLDKVLDKNGNVIAQYKSKTSEIPMTQAQIQFIKTAMQKVIKDGTAAKIGTGLKYTMAGKTGTAQVVGMSQNSRKNKFAGNQYRDHAWFIAFAPVEKPKIAIAIIIENGGWGASTTPIARQLFDYYLLNLNNIESSN